MGTVNFECGHCHSLMAVGEEFLGQPVRCPHCQQVVLAPAPVPSPFDAPTLRAGGPDEHDSIFTPPEVAGDDLFGAPPPIQISTESLVPSLSLAEPVLPADAAPPSATAAAE